jgi:hypothetical protein
MSTNSDTSGLSRVRQPFVIVDALIILYVVLDAIAQALPPHYSPISQAESLLAVGPYGYVMTVNFLNRGVFSLLFVFALVQILTILGENWRSYKWGLYAVGIWGVGALLLAGFPATGRTLGIHTIIAIIVFTVAPLGELSISLKLGRVRAFAGVRKTALTVAVLGVLFMAFYWGVLPFLHQLKSGYGGLFERMLIGSVIMWMGVMSTYIWLNADSLRLKTDGASISRVEPLKLAHPLDIAPPSPQFRFALRNHWSCFLGQVGGRYGRCRFIHEKAHNAGHVLRQKGPPDCRTHNNCNRAGRCVEGQRLPPPLEKGDKGQRRSGVDCFAIFELIQNPKGFTGF